jgi:hypothetical protein
LANIVSTTTHKYKWKFQEVFSVFMFLAIPVALFIFTPRALFWSAGTISAAIAIFLVYIGFARKKKSALTAHVYDDGTVSVAGNGYEADKNRTKLSHVSSVKWEKYTYHPTILLQNNKGEKSLKLPRRIATDIRENLSRKIYVDPEAQATLDEILEEPEDRDVKETEAVEKQHQAADKVELVEEREIVEAIAEADGVKTSNAVDNVALAEKDEEAKELLEKIEGKEEEEAETGVVSSPVGQRVQPRKTSKSKR